jgi:hypothetical protein
VEEIDQAFIVHARMRLFDDLPGVQFGLWVRSDGKFAEDRKSKAPRTRGSFGKEP